MTTKEARKLLCRQCKLEDLPADELHVTLSTNGLSFRCNTCGQAVGNPLTPAGLAELMTTLPRLQSSDWPDAQGGVN